MTWHYFATGRRQGKEAAKRCYLQWLEYVSTAEFFYGNDSPPIRNKGNIMTTKSDFTKNTPEEDKELAAVNSRIADLDMLVYTSDVFAKPIYARELAEARASRVRLSDRIAKRKKADKEAWAKEAWAKAEALQQPRYKKLMTGDEARVMRSGGSNWDEITDEINRRARKFYGAKVDEATRDMNSDPTRKTVNGVFQWRRDAIMDIFADPQPVFTGIDLAKTASVTTAVSVTTAASGTDDFVAPKFGGAGVVMRTEHDFPKAVSRVTSIHIGGKNCAEDTVIDTTGAIPRIVSGPISIPVNMPYELYLG
jgi:hypothetical protein